MARGGACVSLAIGAFMVLLALLCFQLHQASILGVLGEYEKDHTVVSHSLDHRGQFVRHQYATCKAIDANGATGSEDFAVVDASHVLLSAADHMTLSAPRVSPGAMFELDLENQEIVEVAFRGYCTEAEVFHPHGISILQRDEELPLVHIVNHRNEGMPDQVLVFQYDTTQKLLLYADTIESDVFVSLNDVVAIGERQFFATNDSGHSRHSVWRIVEQLLPFWSGSTVVYYDGETASVVVDAGMIQLANGINVSPDRTTLYVAGTLDSAVHVYDIRLQPVASQAGDVYAAFLRHQRSLYVGTGVDNIEVDREDGSLWVACHPSLARFLLHATNHDKPAPSEVIHVHNISAHRMEDVFIERVFRDNGDGANSISASSTATRIGPTGSPVLVVSPVFDDVLLLCS